MHSAAYYEAMPIQVLVGSAIDRADHPPCTLSGSICNQTTSEPVIERVLRLEWYPSGMPPRRWEPRSTCVEVARLRNFLAANLSDGLVEPTMECSLSKLAYEDSLWWSRCVSWNGESCDAETGSWKAQRQIFGWRVEAFLPLQSSCSRLSRSYSYSHASQRLLLVKRVGRMPASVMRDQQGLQKCVCRNRQFVVRPMVLGSREHRI